MAACMAVGCTASMTANSWIVGALLAALIQGDELGYKCSVGLQTPMAVSSTHSISIDIVCKQPKHAIGFSVTRCAFREQILGLVLCSDSHMLQCG